MVSKRDPGFLAVMMVVALTASGCTALRADLNTTVTVGSVAAPTTSPSSTTTTFPGRDCAPSPPVAGPATTRLGSIEPGEASLSISRAVFSCADAVVVTAGNDLALVAVSAQLAAALGGPLLIAADGDSSAVEAELERLAPRTVTLVGDTPPLVLPVDAVAEVLEAVPDQVAAAAYEALEADIRVDLPSGGIAATARVLEPIATGGSVWVPASGEVEACDRDDM